MTQILICQRCLGDPLTGRMLRTEVTRHHHINHAASAGDYPRITIEDIPELSGLYIPQSVKRYRTVTATLEPNQDDGLASLKLWAEYENHHTLTAAVSQLTSVMDWELSELVINRRTNCVARLTRPEAVIEQTALQVRKADARPAPKIVRSKEER